MSTDVFAILIAFGWPLVLAALGFIFRNYIGEWLKKKVEFDFNAKLEKLKGEIQAKQKQLDDLKGAVLQASAARLVALDARRLQAVENIWAGVMHLAPWRMAAQVLGSINIEKASKEVVKDERAKQVFAVFGKNLDAKNMPKSPASNERPFASEPAWAYYMAYTAIVTTAVMIIKCLEEGLDATAFIKIDPANKLIAAALPHYADYLEKWGASGYHLLLEELENKLLGALRDMLEGKTADEVALKNAYDITRAAENLTVVVQERSEGIG